MLNYLKSPLQGKSEALDSATKKDDHLPLAEKMRPNKLDDYIGQSHLIGPKTILNDLLKNGEIPSMILWGPPGCGKTSLINVIIQECKKMSDNPIRFIKMSATTTGINDVRKAVTEAENQSKLGRRTVVFMDEIHRFNKLQQDIFLPHVEAGTFILIGATTENPSSGLNSALLSRCRVFVLKKLTKEELISITTKAISSMGGKVVGKGQDQGQGRSKVQFIIDEELVEWLAECCDGDARVALSGLEMSVQATVSKSQSKTAVLELENIKTSLMKMQSLSEKKTDYLHHLHSALYHCIVASDENAALYWLARVMETGEDPVYTSRKLIAIAGEEVGLDDEFAMSTAVHTLHACQMIGMPECDVVLGQCVTILARAEKSREVADAFHKCQNTVENHKGPQPKVPTFIMDTSARRKLKATVGSNLVQQENVIKSYLPQELEGTNFFE
ncbi:hypothetical protein QAD02_022081 [Eretmocerus hayati]|uniref:Uncharacterized protein n=1 Tax=Eretmocerus hayati TaxID=131215 RepID=A0ACC2PSA0_9HYME|nr:hypothetical protein QAD02_022081 [Eretmocerus hayati]